MSDPGHERSGWVSALWRYPVKSMGGEEVDACEVTTDGLLGDRAYALIDDQDGKVASAKNPRKWPRLLEFSAAYLTSPRPGSPLPTAQITLPDGRTVATDQPDVEAVLSAALHRQVHLEAAHGSQEEAVEATFPNPWVGTAEQYWPDMEGQDVRDTVTDFNLPEGAFFDLAAVHVLTTASLDRLGGLYRQGRFAARRFRPNIVVDTSQGEAELTENGWIGRTLQVGDQVQLAITQPCLRCVMITLPQSDLPKDIGILRTVAQHTSLTVGVYASVLRGGQVCSGDSVTVR